MNTVIRRCTIADLQVLEALARRTFYDTFTGTCTEDDMQSFLDTFYNETRLRQELNDPDDLIFFAEYLGHPVGFVRFKEGPMPFTGTVCRKPLELNRLYVDKPFLGQGLAQQLMDLFMDYAAANEHDFLWLGVWEHNYRAQAFYRKYGFTFTGFRHPFPIGNTPQTDEWWGCQLRIKNE